jgi:hypothetical protein
LRSWRSAIRIEGRFRRIDANRLTAVVYRDGHAVARCSIFLGDRGGFGGGIAYSNNDSGMTNSDKGEFMLADRRYCYPLTITDFASRYLFACEALATTKEAYAFPVFEAVFKE